MRVHQTILIITFVGFCWLSMQAVHEMGHVIGATTTGGQVQRVVLHPLAFSRTDVSPNPHPLIEVWAGPAFGVLLPLAVWAVVRWRKESGEVFVRFFAGFCCLANGIYIAFGPSTTGMDTEIMLTLGCRRWQLVLFGVPAIALGLWLWNGTGRAFGIGRPGGYVNRNAVRVSAVLFAGIVVVELLAIAL
ncbi:MAG: hypothetical protein GY851_04330 [bacterium]|nr:hypothetical protein [bacterium]